MLERTSVCGMIPYALLTPRSMKKFPRFCSAQRSSVIKVSTTITISPLWVPLLPLFPFKLSTTILRRVYYFLYTSCFSTCLEVKHSLVTLHMSVAFDFIASNYACNAILKHPDFSCLALTVALVKMVWQK